PPPPPERVFHHPPIRSGHPREQESGSAYTIKQPAASLRSHPGPHAACVPSSIPSFRGAALPTLKNATLGKCFHCPPEKCCPRQLPCLPCGKYTP
ncbi:unnamed protein product, partial [Staurois parvus]